MAEILSQPQLLVLCHSLRSLGVVRPLLRSWHVAAVGIIPARQVLAPLVSWPEEVVELVVGWLSAETQLSLGATCHVLFDTLRLCTATISLHHALQPQFDSGTADASSQLPQDEAAGKVCVCVGALMPAVMLKVAVAWAAGTISGVHDVLGGDVHLTDCRNVQDCCLLCQLCKHMRLAQSQSLARSMQADGKAVLVDDDSSEYDSDSSMPALVDDSTSGVRDTLCALIQVLPSSTSAPGLLLLCTTADSAVTISCNPCFTAPVIPVSLPL